MIRITKMCIVDGAEVQVSAEAMLAPEALLSVEAAIKALGAAPSDATIDSGKPGRRSRRTKQEMEIARAAAAGGVPVVTIGDPIYAEPLPGPMPPVEPARVFGPPETVATPLPLISTVTVGIGSERFVGVGFDTSTPPISLDGKTVGFDAPPPPTPLPSTTKSPEEELCERIDVTIKQTIELKPEWEKGVVSAFHTYANRHGGDIWKMNLAQLDEVLKGVVEYKGRVEAQIAAQFRR